MKRIFIKINFTRGGGSLNYWEDIVMCSFLDTSLGEDSIKLNTALGRPKNI